MSLFLSAKFRKGCNRPNRKNHKQKTITQTSKNQKTMLYKLDYADWMINVRGFSALSAKTYSDCITRFENYAAENQLGDERHFSYLDAARFLHYCMSVLHYQAKTTNLHRCALTSYYNYCIKVCGYTSNPFAQTDKIREEKKLPNYVTEEQIQRVLARYRENNLQDCRDKTIILLLAHCGLRASEVINLHPWDINSSEVHVHGKGNKWRVIPISAAIRDSWHRYMILNEKTVRDWLFTKRNGEKLSRTGLYSIIYRAFSQECPSECCHPHALRHSFATICMMHNVPISNIQHWMGHASPQTTLQYMSVVNGNTNPFDTF